MITHVVVWVGAEFYPNVWDFIEETRVAGASRKVAPSLDFTQLGPESCLLFVHAGARVQLVPTTFTPNCPQHKHLDFSAPCLDGAKRLPVRSATGYAVSEDTSGQRTRTLPCGHTFALPPVFEDGIASVQPAVFMRLPITAISLVERRDGSFPEFAEASVRRARLRVQRVRE
jgi:hypothetical protein